MHYLYPYAHCSILCVVIIIGITVIEETGGSVWRSCATVLMRSSCVQTATIIMDGCDSGLSLVRAAGMEGYRCANRTTIELERRWVPHLTHTHGGLYPLGRVSYGDCPNAASDVSQVLLS